MNDVVLVEVGGVLQAHHRRNINARLAVPWELVDGLAPDGDRPVTAVVPIRHGSGSSIFAVLRGLLVRDLNRIANILYVAGPEVIIVTDLAANVRHYQQVIATLDRPPPFARQRVRISVHEVPSAWWSREQQAARTPAALLATLRRAAEDAASGVSLLAGARPDAHDPRVRRRGVLPGDPRRAATGALGARRRRRGPPGGRPRRVRAVARRALDVARGRSGVPGAGRDGRRREPPGAPHRRSGRAARDRRREGSRLGAGARSARPAKARRRERRPARDPAA